VESSEIGNNTMRDGLKNKSRLGGGPVDTDAWRQKR
jgi:hypothetical protein